MIYVIVKYPNAITVICCVSYELQKLRNLEIRRSDKYHCNCARVMNITHIAAFSNETGVETKKDCG
jgi:hypothetical protein